MPSKWSKLLTMMSTNPQTGEKDPLTPEMAHQDDINPRNLQMIDETMRARDMQHPRQQAALMAERRRLEQVQAQRMQQGAQMFQQRLEQRLNPRIGTQEDADPQAQAQFMAALMARMQQRYPGMPESARNNYDPNDKLSQFIREQSQISNNIGRLRSGQAVYFPEGSANSWNRKMIP